jgi:hypothetical protein
MAADADLPGNGPQRAQLAARPTSRPAGAENPRHLGRCFAGCRRLGHADAAWRAVWFGLACDDVRLAGLKLIFLVITRVVSVLGLSRREA